MENGCKFSPDHAVQVRLQRLPGYFSVRFHNQGPPFPPPSFP
jgi:hypothetical protein